MNGTNKEKEIVPPVTITVSGDDGPAANEKNGSADEGGLTDEEIEYFRNRRGSSRKASFFIGDDEHIPVTVSRFSACCTGK